MTRNFDDENKEPPQIIIQDLRHARAGDEAEEEELIEEAPAAPEPAAPPAPEPPVAAQAPPMEVMEAPQAEAPVDNADPAEATAAEQAHAAESAPGQPEGGQPGQQMGEEEYRQVMAIFELGLDNYQKSQLGIYIQFALIHLGRMPHPATGLVATDTTKARFAIDLLHVCFSHLEKDLAPEELQEFRSVLSQLQMTFAQIAGSAPAPPTTEDPQG